MLQYYHSYYILIFYFIIIGFLLTCFFRIVLPNFQLLNKKNNTSFSERVMHKLAYISFFCVFGVIFKLGLGNDSVCLPFFLALLMLGGFSFTHIMNYNRIPSMSDYIYKIIKYICMLIITSLAIIILGLLVDIAINYSHLLLICLVLHLKDIFFDFPSHFIMEGGENIAIAGGRGMSYNKGTNSSWDWNRYVKGDITAREYLKLSLDKCNRDIGYTLHKLKSKLSNYNSNKEYESNRRLSRLVRIERENLIAKLGVKQKILNDANILRFPFRTVASKTVTTVLDNSKNV